MDEQWLLCISFVNENRPRSKAGLVGKPYLSNLTISSTPSLSPSWEIRWLEGGRSSLILPSLLDETVGDLVYALVQWWVWDNGSLQKQSTTFTWNTYPLPLLANVGKKTEGAGQLP